MRLQDIAWSYAGYARTYFNKIIYEIRRILFTKMNFETLSAKWWSFCFSFSSLVTMLCSFADPDNPIMEAPSPHRQNCLVGYTPYQYGCFRLLSTTQKSWEEMRDECRSHSTDTIKSDLVSIHSSAEDATLHIRVMQYGGRAWVGFKENEVYFEQSKIMFGFLAHFGKTIFQIDIALAIIFYF